MFLNIFKSFIIAALLSTCVMAQERITFVIPDGWTLQSKEKELVFAPKNTNTERLVISVNQDKYTPEQILQKQIESLKAEHRDFISYPVNKDCTMTLGCSQNSSFCKVIRCMHGEQGSILMTYTNFQPHYSQGFFQKWTNILSQIVSGTKEKGQIFEL